MPYPPFQQRTPDGELVISAHDGQLAALASCKRIVAVIAGGRSGKTVLGPVWLHQEMQEKGAGDYLVAAPSYPLIDKAAGPEIEAYFGGMLGFGTLRRSPMQFVFNSYGCEMLGWGRPERQPRILFAHADDPYTLEAMSAKAAWLDEAGQPRFRLASWQAVQQRLSIDRGRCLITTKPYVIGGWLKKLIYDPWQDAKQQKKDCPEIDVIQFGSAANPAMPPEELARAKATLPRWKYLIDYEGKFEKPAGLIYDCFDDSLHQATPRRIPNSWPRWGGIDFGGVNTAAVLLARHPDGNSPYVAYAEYRAGGRTAAGHAQALHRIVGRWHDPLCGEQAPWVRLWAGGSKSEGQWRNEFGQAGMVVAEPVVADVEVGIQRVYSLIQTGRLHVSAACPMLLDELASYSRVVDDSGEPTEAIEDKETYHLLDALRYICQRLESQDRKGPIRHAPKVIGGGNRR